MIVVIIGPQGSGKGTQAKLISEKYNIPHISTGDIFRDNIKRGTELGKKIDDLVRRGEYVPDKITNKIVQERLKENDCKNGYILDGYPRTPAQGEFLDRMMKDNKCQIDYVVYLKVGDEETIKRISSRRVCENCGANYNLIFIKPKKDGICDKCNGNLILRKDDTPDAVKKRLNQYHALTEPLLEQYEKLNVIKYINGEQPIADVFKEIVEKVEKGKE